MTTLGRHANLTRLADESFDLLIVGGGITGACLALDAATRGIRTALVEKGDFGHATSSASSKLLHGGIRFLQQLRVDKVRESAFERVYFQNLAPHLCHYVPFLVPTFSGLKSGKAFLAAGAAAYSAISIGQNRAARHETVKVPMPRLIGRSEVVSRIPWLGDDWRGTGALVLPECHMKSSERMTLAIIRAAAEAGAAVVNYAQVTKVGIDDNRVVSVTIAAEDATDFEVRTDGVANCAGPWLGVVDGLTPGNDESPISSFFRGSHLVLDGIQLDCALALPTPQKIQGVTSRGGRHVFMIPWRDHVLLGTSYAPHSSKIDRVAPTPEDAEQLLDAVNSALGREFLTGENVRHAFAGIYPITAAAVKSDEYQGASDFVFTNHGRSGGPVGYFSVFGAKYTTARKLAEVACDGIARHFDRPLGNCRTRDMTLAVADIPDADAFCDSLLDRYRGQLDTETARHLYEVYGKDAENVLQIAAASPALFERFDNARPNIAAEAVFSARNEMLLHLDDFVLRRTGLGTIGNPGADAVRRSAELIGQELGWSQDRISGETDAMLALFPRLYDEAA